MRLWVRLGMCMSGFCEEKVIGPRWKCLETVVMVIRRTGVPGDRLRAVFRGAQDDNESSYS